MRLLPAYWSTQTMSTYNGNKTISNLEDEVLDLCKSPMYVTETTTTTATNLDIEGDDDDACIEKKKQQQAEEEQQQQQQRSSLNDFNQSDKKILTTNNNVGYKSLIKQAKPKTYLCLSRKAEKRRRFGQLKLTKLNGRWYKRNNKYINKRNGLIVKRQNLTLNEQQKKLLRLRRKKILLTKEQQEQQEQHKNIIQKETQNQNQNDNANENSNIQQQQQSQQIETIKNVPNDTTTTNTATTITTNTTMNCKNTITTTKTTTATATNKPRIRKRNNVLPLHVLETIDAVARGYFSEPETPTTTTTTTTSSSSSLSLSKSTSRTDRDTNTDTTNNIQNGRNQNKKVKDIIMQKRSKSETKRPLKHDHDLLLKNDILPNLHVSLKRKSANSPWQSITSTSTTTTTTTTTSTTKTTKKSSSSSSASASSASKSKNKCLKSKDDNITTTTTTTTKTTNNNNNIENLNNNDDDNNDKREKNNNNIDLTTTTTTITPTNTNTAYTSGSSSGSINTIDMHVNDEMQQQQQEETKQQQNNIDIIQQQQQQHSENDAEKFMQPTMALMARIACHQHHHVTTKRSRSRSKFGCRKRPKQKHSTVLFELDDTVPPVTRGDIVPKWNNGWTWEGQPFQGAVFLNSDDPLVIRTCYPAMRHTEGDIIRTRDCVLLKANEDNELPYVAKVAHLWKNPEDGEMMMSLLWYYRPEHTEQGRQPNDSPDEVLASRHRDHNSVACIEDKCYVLTFSEYCRYRRRLRAAEEDIEDVSIVPKRSNCYNFRSVPDNTNPELVMFCRRAYEFRTKRLLKMPSKQDYYVKIS